MKTGGYKRYTEYPLHISFIREAGKNDVRTHVLSRSMPLHLHTEHTFCQGFCPYTRTCVLSKRVSGIPARGPLGDYGSFQASERLRGFSAIREEVKK